MAVNATDFSKDAVKAKAAKSKIDLSASSAAIQRSKDNLAQAANGSLAAMFGIDTNVSTANGIQEIAVSQLIPYSQPELGFKHQPFKVLDNDEMQELAADIKENGIYQALIVKPHENGYMILAGHRRHHAAQLAGLQTIPCVVKDVDDDTAAMIVVQTNLLHRQKILPSEKAFAYKLRLESMKRQAGRPGKNNSAQIGRNLEKRESREILAEEVGESRNQISRFIRLTNLQSDLLNMVDAGTVPMIAGVNLSYLPTPLQKFVYDTLTDADKQMTIELSEQLRNATPLDEDTLQALIIPPATPKKAKEPKPEKPREIKIPFHELAHFFSENATDQEITEQIKQALSLLTKAQE